MYYYLMKMLRVDFLINGVKMKFDSLIKLLVYLWVMKVLWIIFNLNV